ncbi:four-carbon acid sugar kinase family protein [Marinoscillum furvescens]|uniref:Uncharacterized protein YgbK (DUF1537 family) n=1 Tax=Marinoscillum furvescens DSM 4134 TaxID=1122208 RepID=A0A3D9L766_MARFU|nr:four-carbon acid sugar kinase family protein [Marinoscillum furvescens]REE01188.1 uncharacterized protein YgbK (DUF1537 family) [Marinoscillum furvescens DSM 4134]
MNKAPSIPTAAFDPNLRNKIGSLHAADPSAVYVMLDDDPTGTQTAYDVPVITRWDVQSLTEVLTGGCSHFFILTNSRSLSEPEAIALGREIGGNLKLAGERANKKIHAISRGDSTLRGHYPAEVDAFYEGFGLQPDLNVLIPAFFEGGRYTIEDVHYLEDGGSLLPVGESPFAQDKSFGYQSSNLKDWVEEKSGGRIAREDVVSVPIGLLEHQQGDQLEHLLQSVSPHQVLIVNATNYQQLDFFTYCLIKSRRSVNVRSAASFVASLLGVPPKPLLAREELVNPEGCGGLIVAGSYVPKTTAQLAYLQKHGSATQLMVNVQQVLQDDGSYLKHIQSQVSKHLAADEDVVLYTSRELLSAETAKQNLQIGQRISEFLVAVVSDVSRLPRFIIAKGGITSSDVATKALGIKEAKVLGQLLPGVPVWQMSAKSRFPGMAYVVFPGNVGGEQALYEAYSKLKNTNQ